MTTVSIDQEKPTEPAAETATTPPRTPITRARWLRGGGLAVGGGLAAFLLMAHDARLRLGVPLGALCTLACVCGVMDLLCAMDPPPAPAARVDGRGDVARAAAWTAATAFLAIVAVWAGVHAIFPQVLAGILLTAGFCGFTGSLFTLGVALGPFRTDENDQVRPLRERHGFWLMCIMGLLYFPALGVASLTDPWETHYGEVAREVLARDDWISLWWSWEGFFYSKPVLGIWLQSIVMAFFGVHVAPGEMLLGVDGRLAHPEWALRLPFALFAIAGTYILYRGVARWFGRRPALIGAIALATCPQWFMVAHQSMTDMPFVACLAACVGVVLLAVRAPDERTPSFELTLGARTLRFDLWHFVFGGVLVIVVPQILYLVSRNLELVLNGQGPYGFRAHLDVVHSGSGLGNCGEPGDIACSDAAPWSRFEPWEQALVWTGLLAGFVLTTWRERRTKRLLYVAAWTLAALSMMAKGPAGIVLPAGAVFIWILATRRWSELPKMALGVGPMILALVVGPWFVAVLVRHGSPFTDELIFHDMFNRAFDHVHDTNSGDDTSIGYYVREFGYAVFPWTALIPVGLFGWLRREKKEADDAALLLFLWFLLTFGLFTMMGTKFHHYILPAVPPAAMLAGITFDSFLEKPTLRESHAAVMLAAATVASALALWLVSRDLTVTTDAAGHFMRLFTYRYDRGWPATFDIRPPIVAATAVGSFILVALMVPRLRRIAAGAWLALAVVWAAWGLDVYLPKASDHWGQRRLMDAYYSQRSGPQEPIVAYQMNWKGENFYTGNRIPQFGTPRPPAGTPKLGTWVKDQMKPSPAGKGTTVMYFVTEHGRTASLRAEVQPKEMHEITTRDDSNQFVLVRAVL